MKDDFYGFAYSGMQRHWQYGTSYYAGRFGNKIVAVQRTPFGICKWYPYELFTATEKQLEAIDFRPKQLQ